MTNVRIPDRLEPAATHNGLQGCALTLLVTALVIVAFFGGMVYGWAQKKHEIVPPPIQQFERICRQHGGLDGIWWSAQLYVYMGGCSDGRDYFDDGTRA